MKKEETEQATLLLGIVVGEAVAGVTADRTDAIHADRVMEIVAEELETVCVIEETD